MGASRSDHSYRAMLDAVIARRSPQRILEWGPGESTLRMRQLLPAAQIISIEHDPKWFEHWRGQLLPLKVDLRLVELGDFYTHPLGLGDGFDLIFVDGRCRRRCLATAAKLLAPGGVVVVHDAQREWYQPGFNHFRCHEWEDYDTLALSQGDISDIGFQARKAMAEKTRVHVVMVTHGTRERFLQRTIPAVLETAQPQPLTLTVVANDPGKRSLGYLESVRERLYGLIVNPKNVGKPLAANAGWRLREAEYTCLLDDDALPLDPGWLEELVAIARDCPQVGIVGHSMEPTDWTRSTMKGHAVQVQPSNLGGACILVPRRTVEACGRYNEELPVYGESDGLYGWKVRRAGLLCVYHDHTATGRRFEHIEDGRDRKYRAWKDTIREQAQVIAARLRREYESGRPLDQ